MKFAHKLGLRDGAVYRLYHLYTTLKACIFFSLIIFSSIAHAFVDANPSQSIRNQARASAHTSAPSGRKNANDL